MSALSEFRRVGVLAFGPALAAAGCLPIRGTVLLSPPVVGVYRGPDGAPVPGARFSLATAFGDSTCAAPTLHATTDSAGVFRFPATEQHYRWVLLVPFDARAPEYTLCAQAGEALRPVYRGVVHGASPRDSVTCTARPGADGAPAACAGRRRYRPLPADAPGKSAPPAG